MTSRIVAQVQLYGTPAFRRAFAANLKRIRQYPLITYTFHRYDQRARELKEYELLAMHIGASKDSRKRRQSSTIIIAKNGEEKRMEYVTNAHLRSIEGWMEGEKKRKGESCLG